MPKLAYTHDLRELAGQANSATEPKKNLVDFQTLAAELDWENIAQFSLSQDHVYDPGGGAPAPLKLAAFLFSAAPGNWVGPNYEPVPGMSASFTAEAGAGVFIVGACDCASTANGTTNRIQLRSSTGGGPITDIAGSEFFIGSAPQPYTPGSTIGAYIAAAGAQVVDLQFNSSAAPPFGLTYAMLWVFVVNR